MWPKQQSILFLFCLFIGLYANTSHALEQVKLQLKWQHQFQFAGYYAAKAKGYYAEAGLDVTFLEASPELDPIEVVLSGKADYGVGSNSLLLAYHAGQPVKALAVIFQHSPYVLLANETAHIQSIHNLDAKRMMIEPHADELIAYMIKEGVDVSKLKRLPHTFDAHSLMNGDTDAMTAYITDEPYVLDKANYPYHYYTPRSVGIDFYGDNLFTSKQRINNNPEQVAAFREASLRGWEYALNHHDEIIDLILRDYSQRKSRDQLQYEAKKMMPLIRPDLIELGYMLPGRWQHIAETYADLGMLPKKISLDDFLYITDHEPDYTKFYWGLGIASVLLFFASLIAMRFVKLNKALNRLLYFKNRQANIGEAINNITHQWKQPLNELSILIMRMQMMIHDNQQDKTELLKITDKCNDILEFISKTLSTFRLQISTNHTPTQFDPSVAITGAINILRDGFTQKNIQVHTVLHQDSMLYGSETEFSNVILSLLINSRNAIVERNVQDAEINISMQSTAQHLTILVQDNGGGITVEPINSIFDMGKSTSTSKDAGLGLYIAKNIIVEKFGGSIWARNSAQGAVFEMMIPLQQRN